MKKVFALSIVCLVALMMTFSTSFAATDCSPVAIKSTGTTTFTASGLFVKLVNNKSTACGSWGPGVERQFYLSTTNTDATYATILTALSLTKTMFVQITGTAAENELLNVVSVKQ